MIHHLIHFALWAAGIFIAIGFVPGLLVGLVAGRRSGKRGRRA